MPQIEHSVTIQRPLFDVYKMATDFERMPEWQPDTTDVGVTAGNPVRAGTMIAMRRRFMGREIFVNFDVVELQRNKSLQIKGVHGTFPMRRTIEFGSSGRETTIRDTIFVKLPWLYFWYGPIFTPALRGQTGKEWQQLKEMLESGMRV